MDWSQILPLLKKGGIWSLIAVFMVVSPFASSWINKYDGKLENFDSKLYDLQMQVNNLEKRNIKLGAMLLMLNPNDPNVISFLTMTFDEGK